MPSPPALRAVVSWSGGKDSCLAAQLAAEQGIVLEALLCMFEPDADRSRSHALPEWIVRAQAAAAGLPLVMPRAGWSDYESRLVSALRDQAASGIDTVIFGDIELEEHRQWEERVCATAGLSARWPLWRRPTLEVAEEALAHGIDAICVCVNGRHLPESFCGRRWNRDFIDDLPAGVDPCGEQGEFHTCVVDAPLFRQPVAVRVTGRISERAPQSLGGDVYWYAQLEQARV